MKLIAELNNTKYAISFRRDGERVFAEIDGREFELNASQPEPNVYLLKHKNHIYEFFIAPRPNSNDPISVSSRGNSFEIRIADPKRLRGTGAGIAQTDGAIELKAQMPGKVVRVLSHEGDSVKEGDGIIVVEAMKMQNEMKSPKDGILKVLRFAEGETVNAGDVLAIIE